MIRYAAATDRCRREMLLEEVGIGATDCSGCDICGDGAWPEPPEREVIQKVIKWNRGRFRKGQLARVLIGRRSSEIRRIGLDITRGIGSLAGWKPEDAEEAIEILTGTRELGYHRFGGFENLYICRLLERDKLSADGDQKSMAHQVHDAPNAGPAQD